MEKLLLPSADKGALEISFGWLFAIFAGIVIIFLAIYLSTKLVNSSQDTVSAETGKEIEIILNPLETSFEAAQTTSMTIPSETRINNICDESGTFGRQGVRLDQKSFGKWIETEVNVYFANKYIFSENIVEGKKFYIFSKPFSFPFKVADLIYLTSSTKRYCFYDAPEEIKREILNMNKPNLLVENCSDEDIKVCFHRSGCEISVDLALKTVTKDRTKVFFSGINYDDSLMYAAIFSDRTIYECQVKRLLLRLKEIASLYSEKAVSLQNVGCTDTISNNLNELNNMIGDETSSINLEEIAMKAASIEEINNAGGCLMW
jgi:hypothetical protein